MNREFVSILMLTHNAPDYVETSVRTVANLTDGVDYELDTTATAKLRAAQPKSKAKPSKAKSGNRRRK